MIRFKFTYSKQAADNLFIQTGKRLLFNSDQVQIEEADLTPGQRAILVNFPFQMGTDLKGARLMAIETYSMKPAHRAGGPLSFSPTIRKPELVREPVFFEQEPTVDQLFEHLVRMTDEYNQAKRAIEIDMVEYDRLYAEHRAEIDARRAEEKVREEEQARQAKLERQQRAIIPWRDDGTAIVNLHQAIMAASGLDTDTRFNHWIREIQRVNRSHDNGYMFEGERIENRTLEIRRGYHVYLVASTTGSRKYQTTDYRVVIMGEDGVLRLTEIETDDSDRGWALRIRDDVTALLAV